MDSQRRSRPRTGPEWKEGKRNVNRTHISVSDASAAFSLTSWHRRYFHNATTWNPGGHWLTAHANSKEHVWGFWEHKPLFSLSPLYSLSINPFTVVMVFIPLAWGDGDTPPKAQTAPKSVTILPVSIPCYDHSHISSRRSQYSVYFPIFGVF